MRRTKTLVSVAVILSAFALVTGDNPLEVKTKSGKVRGIKIKEDVDAFLGIPYGAAADGKNRFAPPKEVGHWDGVLDSNKLPNPCYQIIGPEFKAAGFISNQKETENCLKLNVWVPKPRPKKCAVMVWIHGGGFALGSTDQPLYNGATLASQEDVIVVSMNYRLSGFGFLYLGHPLAPGNAGLMDQALALKWVKKNIKAFGGDPNRITIFGESAGAGSVGLQLLAPSSLDLFNNAILQSGAAPCFWSTQTPKEALEQSLKLAGKVGCPTNLDQREEIVQCLQDVSIEKLAGAMISMEEVILAMSFRPVVDGEFLPDNPSKLLEEGKFCGQKKVLIGYTREDGSFILQLRTPHQMKDDAVYTEEQILQLMATTSINDKKLEGLPLDLVKNEYTDWESYPEDRVAARSKLVHFLTDRWFACGALETANRMTAKGNNVFFYRFDHIPEKGLLPVKLPQWIGSTHGSELLFAFGGTLNSNNLREAKLSKQVMRYWANFARNSDPNDEFLTTWPKYNSGDRQMLLLDADDHTVIKNDRTKECAFWDNVFPSSLNKPKNEL